MVRKVFSLFLLLGFWAVLSGQEYYQPNTKYVNFTIERVPLISGGYFLQPGLALEAGVGFAFNGEQDSDGLSVRLGMDKYFRNDRLSPLAGGFLRFDINPNALEETYWEGSRMIIGGHAGLQYFLLKQLALAGRIGLELKLNSPKNGADSTTFSTFTSGLSIRFFF